MQTRQAQALGWKQTAHGSAHHLGTLHMSSWNTPIGIGVPGQLNLCDGLVGAYAYT